jgi:hypothetical protein
MVDEKGLPAQERLRLRLVICQKLEEICWLQKRIRGLQASWTDSIAVVVADILHHPVPKIQAMLNAV